MTMTLWTKVEDGLPTKYPESNRVTYHIICKSSITGCVTLKEAHFNVENQKFVTTYIPTWQEVDVPIEGPRQIKILAWCEDDDIVADVLKSIGN